MATEFCEKCKQSHPGKECDYDEMGDCEETRELDFNQISGIVQKETEKRSS
ncbi:MAG TPA: hypothetical protein VF753_12905 [Terriglobales bacterium]